MVNISVLQEKNRENDWVFGDLSESLGLLFPKGGIEDHQSGEHLKSADQHIPGREPLAGIGD